MEMAGSFGAVGEAEIVASHALLIVQGGMDRGPALAGRVRYPDLRVMSIGERIEIYKEAGDPREFIERFRLAEVSATHVLGHTRMATESTVTTGLPPVRDWPRPLPRPQRLALQPQPAARVAPPAEGIEFQTDNDSEVAAGYLTWRLREGATARRRARALPHRPRRLLHLRAGTADGFAVLRDPIACKPAVMAETDDWVAMASEYRAIAALPGAEDARSWEPEPGRVYHWTRAKVA